MEMDKMTINKNFLNQIIMCNKQHKLTTKDVGKLGLPFEWFLKYSQMTDTQNINAVNKLYQIVEE